ncbi:hypothetical protein ACDQ55_16960 [Chitinophaga sp. 30R24]|uniref:hypothetical protein n=1 Tax=Chitinophaga sp. 30R24 TaxID=3248838 RepID=UPI003B909EF7
MKALKFAVMAAAAFVGLTSAYAGSLRAVFTYVNIGSSIYTRLTNPYNAANCVTPDPNPCAYTTTANLPTRVTKHQLTTAFASPKGGNRIYIH